MVGGSREAGAIVLAKSNLAEWAFTPLRDGELDPARLHAQPVRARPRDRRLERRHGGGGRGEPRRGGVRHRHRQLDPRAVVVPGARRHPLDDGAHVARRRRAAQRVGRRRRPDGAHRRRRGGRVPGRRRRRSGRLGDAQADASARRRLPRVLVAGGLKGARIGVLRQAYERPSPTRRSLARVRARGGAICGAAGAVVSTRRASIRSTRSSRRSAAAATASRPTSSATSPTRGPNAPGHDASTRCCGRRALPPDRRAPAARRGAR